MMWFRQPRTKKVAADMISAGGMILQSRSKYSVRLDQNEREATAVYVLDIKSLDDKDAADYRCVVQELGKPFADYPFKEMKVHVKSGSYVSSSFKMDFFSKPVFI